MVFLLLMLQVESTGVMPAEDIVRQAVDSLLQRINVLQTELQRAEQASTAGDAVL